ncbi:hypothetical protein G3N55_05160 [Dissulfurirhabdus thermomarina]|uniref:Uncharacterized protein n=1 Tax=Dissulfurirhabdus thermomarina TaxID=1765737 RepID=A0A6N9TLS6_DISTH|nr:hypothetical protein [Dissulfurirhabdus thermomarina]NDY42231.1 hypothetical protein [Dissulfurirhabdus thermomarina]NMX23157.1 hypothetical protein [Dissulfurirhabdus thermomarina]
MGEIRSSLEIAMEKAERLGRASKEEVTAAKWREAGRKAAADFLFKPDVDLKGAVSGFDREALPKVLEGVQDVLLRNVNLPRNPDAWPTIRRALAGLVELKGSPAAQVVAQVEQLLKAYEQTLDQYRRQMRSQLEGRLGSVRQAVAQQYGAAAAANVDVEALPEFQQEWSRISGEIAAQFEAQLAPLKHYLSQL